jgi:hypothetical protein
MVAGLWCTAFLGEVFFFWERGSTEKRRAGLTDVMGYEFEAEHKHDRAGKDQMLCNLLRRLQIRYRGESQTES